MPPGEEFTYTVTIIPSLYRDHEVTVTVKAETRQQAMSYALSIVVAAGKNPVRVTVRTPNDFADSRVSLVDGYQ